MNEARRIILAMSKPLAEVARTIDHNVQAGEKAKEQINKLNFLDIILFALNWKIHEQSVDIRSASNLFQWALLKLRTQYTKQSATKSVLLQAYLRKHKININ